MTYFAFPDNYYFPTKIFELFIVALITLNIIDELSLPKFSIAFWRHKPFASLVSVPKATIHKHNRLILGQDDIRFAGKFWHILSVPKPPVKQILSNNFFGLSVFTWNTRHVSTSNFRASIIHNYSIPLSFSLATTAIISLTWYWLNCVYTKLQKLIALLRVFISAYERTSCDLPRVIRSCQ